MNNTAVANTAESGCGWLPTAINLQRPAAHAPNPSPRCEQMRACATAHSLAEYLRFGVALTAFGTDTRPDGGDAGVSKQLPQRQTGSPTSPRCNGRLKKLS